MVVPITDVVKMTLSVADISDEPIIGTPLMESRQTNRNLKSQLLYCIVENIRTRKQMMNIANDGQLPIFSSNLWNTVWNKTLAV